MPLALLTYPTPQIQLALWEITENREQLFSLISPTLSDAEMHSRSLQSGALQFLAARVLCSQMYKHDNIELIKSETNKPHLLLNKTNMHISISHSFELAGIITSQEIPVAMDIEKKDRRIGRVMYKFLHPNELSFAGNTEQTAEQILIWSAKETLYKLDGEKSLDFREHLRIEPFTAADNGTLTGAICRNNQWKKHTIRYFTHLNYYITYIAET